jgi:hypothetical protein
MSSLATRQYPTHSPHMEYAIDSTPDQPHHAVQWVSRACHGLVALSASDWPV